MKYIRFCDLLLSVEISKNPRAAFSYDVQSVILAVSFLLP